MINVSYFTFWPQRYGGGSGRLCDQSRVWAPGKAQGETFGLSRTKTFPVVIDTQRWNRQ